MSIAPPSDIILDVAQAADPLKLQAATAKLAQSAGRLDGTPSFAAALESAGSSPRSPIAPLRTTPGAPPAPAAGVEPQKANVYKKFEAMVLQSFIENILPKDANLFGDAASADMGRSLMAEQIANQMARSGRIGIAKSMERGAAGAHAEAGLPPVLPLVPRA